MYDRETDQSRINWKKESEERGLDWTRHYDEPFEDDIMAKDGERIGKVLLEIIEERKGHFYGATETGKWVGRALLSYLEKEIDKINYSDHSPLLSSCAPGPLFSYFAEGLMYAFQEIDPDYNQKKVHQHMEEYLAKHGTL